MSNKSINSLLQKKNAEIARLEGQLVIEAALERVRARTMRMQRSQELRDVVSVMYDEMELLGLAKWGCQIMLCHKDKEVFEFWLVEETDSNQKSNYFAKGKEHPVYRKIWMNWENQTNSFTLHHRDEYKRAFDNYWIEETDFKHLPDEVKASVYDRNEVFLNYAPMKYGLLNAIGYEKPSDNLLAILTRFARVFEQAYTRFLDIKKAEDQALRLQELDHAKTIFYTNITHEFRTPLTVIMGITDNIKGHQNEKKLINKNSKNLLRLVNELLDLSKLEAGEMKLHRIHANIIPYLKYLTESFHSMAEEQQIDLHFQSELEELLMDFDESKIQHIIYNLLSNALKFSNVGDQVILQVAKIELKSSAHLQLKVSDTGIGIAEKNLAHLFDRFYQADATATRKGEGTGIGLALTKELVELMNGEISVKSKLGKGTDFTILLPIKKESNLSESVQSAFQKPKLQESLVTAVEFLQQDNLSSEKPQLLIIEDNQDITIYISTLLGADYQISTAQNGQEGIDKAIEIVPDIIISDVMMPEKNGYEVCETLKQDERTSHIPIILLTAKATQDAKVEGLKYGADAYLTKPFHKEELLVRLEQLVALRKQLQAKYVTQQANETSKTELLPSIENAFLKKLNAAITSHLDDTDFSVAQLAQIMLLSQVQLYRKVKALTGKNTMLYIRSLRLKKAKELLRNSDLNISEIAYEVGFSDPSYFSRAFQKEFNRSPTFFRK